MTPSEALVEFPRSTRDRSRCTVRRFRPVDIAFGFGTYGADVNRASGSNLSYYVAVGYLGDHRFNLLRGLADTVKSGLRKKGAKFIVSFFDENSGDDARWHTGHQLQRDNYAAVLEQVLADPTLGLVLKPKVPATLRKRLGPVAELLAAAEATGRCHLFVGGAIQGSYPPAVAALASDLAIHGHLSAATAGLEAALAGVPTLLVDSDGWPTSPLNKLGMNQVVFTDWSKLWKTVREHRSRLGGMPGLGDWSIMLNDLDPFRDGKASQRMGAYIQWLLNGLKAGLTRESAMAEAAERYSGMWGQDKVVEFDVEKSRLRYAGPVLSG
jgi:hypothetical protein